MFLTLKLGIRFQQLNLSDRANSITKPVNRFQKYRRHYDLISEFNLGLKSLLKVWEPEFIEYKLRWNEFSDQLRNKTNRYKRTGYNMSVMQQTASYTVNPITVDNFATLFYCSPAGRSSDSMKDPAWNRLNISWLVLGALSLDGPTGVQKWSFVALAFSCWSCSRELILFHQYWILT